MLATKKQALSVSELTGHIKEILEGSFDSVYIEGEISNLKAASSGHIYFNLKDSSSMIQAVMFRGKAMSLRFAPSDGMLVRVKGGVTVYPARGNYQILVESMELAGEGNILLMLEALKKKLASEGLFDEDRKRPLPRFPHTVAVITSPTGAAVHDIINVITRRNANLRLIVLPSAVQGEAAPRELVTQLHCVNHFKMADVIIIGRGGGSLEDLLAFSHEDVVRAVAASEIPVISAVGHEVDWALCDFAADLRAPTPSAAAELVSESSQTLESEIEFFKHELLTVINSKLERARFLLARFDAENVKNRLMLLCAPFWQSLDAAKNTLVTSMQEKIRAYQGRTALAQETLMVASPQSILARGYALVTLVEKNEIIKNSKQLKVANKVHMQFAHGSALATVEKINDEKK